MRQVGGPAARAGQRRSTRSPLSCSNLTTPLPLRSLHFGMRQVGGPAARAGQQRSTRSPLSCSNLTTPLPPRSLHFGMRQVGDPASQRSARRAAKVNKVAKQGVDENLGHVKVGRGQG